MQAGNYVDPAINYEQTAQAWANRLEKPFSTDSEKMRLDLQILEALFYDVYPETIDYIEADPSAFAERVAAYRHNVAMQHKSEC